MGAVTFNKANLSLRNGGFLEQLQVTQHKKFPVFQWNGSCRNSDRHWTLSCIGWNQCTFSNHTYFTFIL